MNGYARIKTTGLALSTALIALALAWPIAASATDEKAKLEPLSLMLGVTRVSKMTVGGCEVSVADAERKLVGAGTPAFELVVVNRGEKARTFTISLSAFRLSAATMGSRMMPMPTKVWSKSIEISAAAGETVRVPVRPAVALAVGETMTLAAMNGDAMQGLASVLVGPLTERSELTVLDR